MSSGKNESTEIPETQYGRPPVNLQPRHSSREVMHNIKIAFSILASITALSATAGPQGDAFGRCLAENTTGKERKEMARWVFVAMTAHPEMRSLSAATEADREQTSRTVGVLFTKLLSEVCAVQAKAAMQAEGSQAMNGAFGTLGQLAMQEIMTNPEVTKAVSDFERFVDKSKVEAAMSGR
jgi:hypothetical protein